MHVKIRNSRTLFFSTLALVLLSVNGLSTAAANVAMVPLTMDGLISDAEWVDADVIETFFIDADNKDGNIDANNTLYIGEDEDYLYIAVDLNSDQTIDPTSEWISIYLNTNGRTFNDMAGWSNYLNNGVESLILNGSTGAIHDPTIGLWDYQENLYYSDQWMTVEPVFNGSIPTGEENLQYYDLDTYVITSTTVDGEQVTWFDVEFDVGTQYGNLAQQILPLIDRYDVHITVKSNTSSPLALTVVPWQPDGTLDLNDPDTKTFSIDSGLFTTANIGLLPSNLTNDNRLKVSVMVNDTSISHETIVNYIQLEARSSQFQDLYGIPRPFSTIENAEMSIGYGSSSLNSTDHRQFEFKIPKSELEHYDPTGELGVLLAGYGTLSFEASNYWTFAERVDYVYEENSSDYFYFDMQGVESRDTSTNDGTSDGDDDTSNNTEDATDGDDPQGDGSGGSVPGFPFKLVTGASIATTTLFALRKRKDLVTLKT